MALTVLVVAAGGIVAVQGLWATDSPATVVRKYFAALRDGDAAKALSFGAAPQGDTRLLTADVLEQQNRIAPLSITVLSVRTDGDRAQVSLRLTAGDAPAVSDSVDLRRRSRQWTMDTTSHAVSITVPVAADRMTLVGRAVPAAPVRLFPGPVPLTADTPALGPDPGAAIVSLSGPAELSVRPVVTDAGLSAVRAGVQAAMRRCLALAAGAPASCPLRAIGDTAVPGSVRGRLTDDGDDPTVTVVPGDEGGALDVTGRFTVSGTSQVLDFENQPSTDRGAQLVPYRARVYASNPSAVQWRTS